MQHDINNIESNIPVQKIIYFEVREEFQMSSSMHNTKHQQQQVCELPYIMGEISS